MATPKIKFTYFDIEGAGEQARLALVLSKTPFEDHRIQFSEWGELKPKTPDGQVPLLTVDDGPVRTQSRAIVRWVGKGIRMASCLILKKPLGLQRIFNVPLCRH